MKRSRSNFRPSSNGFSTDAATVSTHSTGAGNGPASAFTRARAAARKAAASGCSTWRSRTFGSGRTSAIRRANASAPSTRSEPAGSTSSNSSVPASFSDATGVPVTIMFSAVSRPSTRGRRCVPPAPGSRPSFTSGSAICAPGSATR